MKTYGGGRHSMGSLQTDDPTQGALLACQHIAKGSIAPVGSSPWCFTCRAPQAVTRAWLPGVGPICATIASHDAIGASDGREDG